MFNLDEIIGELEVYTTSFNTEHDSTAHSTLHFNADSFTPHTEKNNTTTLTSRVKESLKSHGPHSSHDKHNKHSSVTLTHTIMTPNTHTTSINFRMQLHVATLNCRNLNYLNLMEIYCHGQRSGIRMTTHIRPSRTLII